MVEVVIAVVVIVVEYGRVGEKGGGGVVAGVEFLQWPASLTEEKT